MFDVITSLMIMIVEGVADPIVCEDRLKISLNVAWVVVPFTAEKNI